MTYEPIEVDEENLTIMGVQFPDSENFKAAKRGIGTNMFEGWVPTKEKIETIRDLLTNKISLEEYIKNNTLP